MSEKYRQEVLPPEGTLNRLGYIQLGKADFKKAIRIFQQNVIYYPHSANVYDSLGDAFFQSGDYSNAFINYTKSLELNPDNVNARKMIAKINENK